MDAMMLKVVYLSIDCLGALNLWRHAWYLAIYLHPARSNWQTARRMPLNHCKVGIIDRLLRHVDFRGTRCTNLRYYASIKTLLFFGWLLLGLQVTCLFGFSNVLTLCVLWARVLLTCGCTCLRAGFYPSRCICIIVIVDMPFSRAPWDDDSGDLMLN